MNPEQFADMAGIHYEINRRLSQLEHRATTTVLAPVDAGGVAWTAGNSAWIDPTTQPEWAELRVRNTPNGSEIWRNMANAAGVLEWTLIA